MRWLTEFQWWRDRDSHQFRAEFGYWLGLVGVIVIVFALALMCDDDDGGGKRKPIFPEGPLSPPAEWFKSRI